jgi:hypothetical protein
MNLRHAAALALVGWYLLVPAPAPFMQATPPIGHWAHLGSYDDEKDCDQALDDTLSSDGVTNRFQNKDQFARRLNFPKKRHL